MALIDFGVLFPFFIGRVRPVHSLFEKKSILKNLIQMAQIDFGVLFPFFSSVVYAQYTPSSKSGATKPSAP